MSEAERPGRLHGRSAWVLDGALAFFALITSVAWTVHPRGDNHAVPPVSVLGIVLAVAASLPIVLRRRFPLGVLAIVETALALHLVTVDSDARLGSAALIIAMFTVASRTPRSTSVRAAIAVIAVNGVIYLGMLALGRVDAGLELIFTSVLTAGSWALGDNIGTRRAYLASLEDRAGRLEREQQERAERAVLDERGRIARELHDVVAHHVSAIAVQAGAAEERADRDPAAAREALAVIQATSRQALAEMRALVGVLRGSDDGAALAPQPGLAQVDRLAAQSRAAGLEVRVRVEGAPRQLPEALDVSAYRIVQEALTNTLRHAHARHADVLVRYAPSELEIMVTDDGAGRGGAASPTGRGLVGMRERVALFQGRLEVGSSPGGGFRVHAQLPIEGLPA
jgi:signal transduction histidine kinase